ncbi:hypothetical protein ALC62_09531 [Cyphomyrmex costatus]|uniref:Uncharacterized protein n=1 Tax=Cyphomyrmex costatus TaxID=456900 RepID=A0A195CGQ3_9HYME|nr:hypothetical protein ALC62_09531 [Cyphomyrmex costatus]
MRLLSDVERLMAARMAVRSEARGSGGATAKVREGLHVLVQARWSATLDVPCEEAIVVFRNVAIQNTWSILAGATNNGRLKWVVYSTYTEIFCLSDAALRGITHLSPVAPLWKSSQFLEKPTQKITNILERRSSPVIKDGAYEDIT